MGQNDKSRKKSKTRDQYIYATTSGEVSAIEFSVDARDGSIRFATEMKDARSETSYAREKGPKVVNRIFQDGPEFHFGSSKPLKNQFEFICAIDTNTKEIRGRRVSVTGVVIVQSVLVGTPDGLAEAWQWFTPFVVEFSEVHVKPEPLGWICALESLYDRKYFSAKTPLAAIVDSDLGLLNSYNSQATPLFADRYLPKNVTLVYASADVSSNDITNEAIRAADSASRMVMRELESGRLAPAAVHSTGPFYDAIRIIEPTGKKSKVR